jgi:hypothetical protein
LVTSFAEMTTLEQASTQQICVWTVNDSLDVIRPALGVSVLDEVDSGGFLVTSKYRLQVCVVGQILRRVEVLGAPFKASGADVVCRPRVFVRSEHANQVTIGGDVFQRVEARLPPLEAPVVEVVAGARVFVRPEHVHQVGV